MQLTPGDHAMTTRRATAPNEKSLEAFLATKRRIDDMLVRIHPSALTISTPTRTRSTGVVLAS